MQLVNFSGLRGVMSSKLFIATFGALSIFSSVNAHADYFCARTAKDGAKVYVIGEGTSRKCPRGYKYIGSATVITATQVNKLIATQTKALLPVLIKQSPDAKGPKGDKGDKGEKGDFASPEQLEARLVQPLPFVTYSYQSQRGEGLVNARDNSMGYAQGYVTFFPDGSFTTRVVCYQSSGNFTDDSGAVRSPKLASCQANQTLAKFVLPADSSMHFPVLRIRGYHYSANSCAQRTIDNATDDTQNFNYKTLKCSAADGF